MIHPRATTEFIYRYKSPDVAQVYLSFKLATNSRRQEVSKVLSTLEEQGMKGYDLSEDELAKSHSRYMIGGAQRVENERLFRFGTCYRFRQTFGPRRGPAARYKTQTHSLRTQNFPKGQRRSEIFFWVYRRNGTSRYSIIETTEPVSTISISVYPGMPLFY